MPLDVKFYSNSMLKSVEQFQKAYKNKEFDALKDEEKLNLYAGQFAARYIANSVRGKKKTLKVPGDQNSWTAKRNELLASQTFQAFVTRQGHAKMKQLLSEGHGGAAEDAFQEYVMDMKQLPTDVPERSMPSAKDRIEQQQKKLENVTPTSDEAAEAYAEIFRCRRAVGTERNKPAMLEPHINGDNYAKQPDLSQNEAFRQFVRENGSQLKKTALSGHGGAAEEMFKEHVLQLDRLPADIPNYYMPQALARTEALQEKLRGVTEPKRQAVLFTELMATREAVGAVRGKKDSLEKGIDSAALQKAYDKWSKCATFQNYLSVNEAEAREAASKGHGGALGDRFKEHVTNLDHIPEDVPEDSMPTAFEHVEALQQKYKGIDYFDSTDERKLTLAAEIMASREAVGAERGKKDSLKKPIDPQKLKDAYRKWSECKAFSDFVKNEERKVYDGAVAGHGGALGDQFKEYVVNRDELEADIPGEYMPTALVRTEALQKKIRESSASPAENGKLYAELMATRSSVGAVRGKKGSLDAPLDPKTLDQDRKKLLESDAFKSFLADPTQSAAIRKAALDGHGGALEDAFQDYVRTRNVIPENTPSRYMPKALERTEELQKKLKANSFENEAERASVYVELMATRDAVGAIRGKKDSLDKTIDGAALQSFRDKWNACETFKAFVSEDSPDYDAVRKAVAAGHGGALMDLFKEQVKREEYLAEDLPEEVIPQADERIEAIQKVLKEEGILMLSDEKTGYYAQILAARGNAGAIRGEKDSLKKRLDPKSVNDKAMKLTNSQAFRDFVQNNKQKLEKLARNGHGGELEDEFKKYVSSMKTLPTDVSREYMPTARERIEGLQDKINSREFQNAELDEKAEYYAELMAARRSVSAERNKKETLNTNVDPAKAAEISQNLLSCQTFKDFIKNDPEAVKKAAVSGHGGALEDAFKKYVLNLNRIPSDVPKDYMPTALERTEALQDKIKSREFAAMSPVNQESVYRELIATRTAANSIRGDKRTLDQTVDAEKLQEAREQLKRSEGVNDFLVNADPRTLKDAAVSGHGGALEDKLREDLMRQSVQKGSFTGPDSARWKPTVSEYREKLRESFVNDIQKNRDQINQNQESYMKKVAAAMYLTKLEKEAKNGEAPKLDKAEMDRNVEKLMKSNAFKQMFENENATLTIVTKIGARRMSEVFEKFSSNGGQFPQPEPQAQPVLQNQRKNERQNQQEAQQNQNEQLQNQNQQRHRANSMRVNRNPPQVGGIQV